MITKTEYKLALIIVREYEMEQLTEHNSERMTIAVFIEKIPAIMGTGYYLRLVNALKRLLEDRKYRPDLVRHIQAEYIDELNEYEFKKIRNAGRKTWDMFCECKTEIL